MDRLFLAGLVRELDARIRGARIRDVSLPGARSLSVHLHHPESLALVWRVDPNPALYLDIDDRSARVSSERTKKLTKLLSGSSIVGMETAPLDRVVTLRLAQTRLSGRKRELSLVLEWFAMERALYVIDDETKRIVDHLAPGEKYEIAGTLYRPRGLPPHARTRASSPREFSERLSELTAGERPNKSALLSASGWTPLLAGELVHLIDALGRTPEEAFSDLDQRLRAETPALYFRDGKAVLSPTTLVGLSEATRVETSGFNDAMVKAATLAEESRLRHDTRQRIGAAVAKKTKSLRSLQKKLLAQQGKLEDPAVVRRRAETLLAGLSRAERVDGGRVRVPDAFDADGGFTEIPIDPRLDLKANAERLFKRSSKAERTEIELEKRLETTEHQLNHAESFALALDDVDGMTELIELLDEAEASGLVRAQRGSPTARRGRGSPTERSGPRTYTSGRGNPILVGRSARSNDELTFRLAKPTDLWLHVAGRAGSHVVLRHVVSGEITQDEIQEAAELAAYFSKARTERYVDVWVTEKRHVSRIKGGPPGLVKLGTSRTVRVSPRAPEDA